jgi:hypothetical protein
MTMRKILFENDVLKSELEDSIIIGTIKTSFVDLDMAKQITNIRLDLQKGDSFPLISNIKSIKNINKEARDFMASKEGCEGVIAAAVIINSSITSMIGNFFIQISKPIVPTRLFTDELEAKKWLADYVKAA